MFVCSTSVSLAMNLRYSGQERFSYNFSKCVTISMNLIISDGIVKLFCHRCAGQNN